MSDLNTIWIGGLALLATHYHITRRRSEALQALLTLGVWLLANVVWPA